MILLKYLDPFSASEELKNKAIVWLSEKTKKSIVKLTDNNFNINRMSDSLDQDFSVFGLKSNALTIMPFLFKLRLAEYKTIEALNVSNTKDLVQVYVSL